MIGGITHPGGLAAAMLVCAGLIGAGFERSMALRWVEARDLARTAGSAAVMAALGLAIYWASLPVWPFAAVLGLAAVLFASARFGQWVPATLMILALLHLAVAGGMLFVSARDAQRDPLYLPMMAASLAVIAALVMASALQIKRRWEPVAP
jgi:hypothetical protein